MIDEGRPRNAPRYSWTISCFPTRLY